MKPEKRRGRWRKRLAIAVPVAVAAYAAIGFLVVPWAAQRWVVPMVSESLNGDVTVDTIRVNPFALSLTLEGVSVTDEAGARVIGLGRLYGNLQASSLFREGFVLGDVALDEPYLLAVLEEDGSLNLAKLIKPSDQSSTEPITLPRVRGRSLAIDAAKLEFIDRMIAGSPDRTVSPISFAVQDFDTQPLHGNTHRFSAATEAAENVTWEGEVFLNPLEATGAVTVTDFDLSVYEPYVQQFAPLQIGSGLASLDLSYEVAPTRAERAVGVTLERMDVTALDVALEAHPLLALERFTIEGLAADAVARSLTVGRIALVAPDATVERESDGTLAVLKALGAIAAARAESASGKEEASVRSDADADAPLIPIEIADSVPKPYDEAVRALIDIANAATQPWSLRLDAFEMSDARAHWSDRAVEPNVELSVADTYLTAGPITSEAAFATDFDFGATVVSGGAIQARGRVEPLASRAVVTAFENTGFALAPLGPYVRQADPRLRLPDGTLSVRGSDLAGALSEAGLPEVRIGEFTVRGAIDLEVHELGPPLDVPLRDLDLALLGLDTAAGDPVQITFLTKVYDGSIAVNGSALPDLADPLGSTIDLNIVIDKFRLQPLSPVSGEYVGRAIEDGTLNTKPNGPLTIQLMAQQLEAVIPVSILGFDFGEKVDSENATKLPVGLAVAVLKGPDGTISPPPIRISGDLSDPSVSIVGIVGHAVTNLVVGVASSPFQMLGGLIPQGEGESGEPPDLSFVGFAPGSTKLTGDAMSKLDLLGEAMLKRPALRMAVRGVPTRGIDEPALRRAAFEAALRENTAATLPEGDPRRMDPSSIGVNDQQYREAVRFAFAAMRSPSPEQAAETPDSAPSAEESRAVVEEPGLDVPSPQAASDAASVDVLASTPGEAERPNDAQHAEANQVMPEARPLAAEEVVADEPSEMRLKLPILAEQGVVGAAQAQTQSRADVRPRGRRLRAGRSVRFRGTAAPTPVAQPASVPSEEAVTNLDAEPVLETAETSTYPEPRRLEPDAKPDTDSAQPDSDVTASSESTAVAATDNAPEVNPQDESVSQKPSDLDADLVDDVASSSAEPTEPPVPFEQAEREVLARVPLPPEAFVDLRQHRVQAVVDYLTGSAGLPVSRVIASHEPARVESTEAPLTPRVLFDLAAAE